MPDANNRLVQRDLERLLTQAELRIVTFEPPALPPPPTDPNQLPPPVDLPTVQAQVANQSAIERSNALFGFLVDLITQGCKDEIAREQITQTLSQIQQDLNAVRDALARHGIT